MKIINLYDLGKKVRFTKGYAKYRNCTYALDESRLLERNCISTPDGYTTLGRAIKKFYPETTSAELDMAKSKIIKFYYPKIELKESKDLSYIYNKNHFGFSSCMYGNGSYFEDFNDREDLKVVYFELTQNYIVGRCLIWGNRYRDYLYCDPSYRSIIENKINKLYPESIANIPFSINININPYNCPYFDSMQYYNNHRGILFNQKFSNLEYIGIDYELVGTKGRVPEYDYEYDYDYDDNY